MEEQAEDFQDLSGYITFRAHGNKKQVEAFKYWMDDETIEIAYGGSKGCNPGHQLVTCKSGKKRIDEVFQGEEVLTINEETGREEWKPVLQQKKYSNGGANEYHKIINFVMKGGSILSLTPNHEIYFEGSWLPAGEFAGRILDVDRWDRESVYDINSWESPFDASLWTERLYHFKTLFNKKRLHKGFSIGSRISKAVSCSQIGCFRFYRESRAEKHSKSYRLQSEEQSCVKPRVDNDQGKRPPFQRQMSSTVQGQERGEEFLEHFNGSERAGDSKKIQEKNCYSRNTRERVWSEPSYNKRRDIAEELDPHLIEEVQFDIMQGYVYDLQVLDNHNYCVTDRSIIIHNSGKSFLGCSIILADALMYPGTHYFIARKTLSDLRKHTTTSIREVLDMWEVKPSVYHYNGQDNFYQFKNGSRIYFLGCEPRPSDPLFARFGSIQMTRGWVEEASEIEDAAKNALAATIGRWKNKDYNLKRKLLLTCNPAKNFLYRDFYKPSAPGGEGLPPEKKFIQALPTDNKMIGDDYIEHLYKTLNYSERQRLLEGNWEYDDDQSVLIDYEAILDVFKNHHVDRSGKRCMTVDVARMGGAKIVCIVWEGYKGTVHSWSRSELPESLKKIEELRIEAGLRPNDVLIDGDGIGPGIGDFGRYSSFRNNFPAFPSLNWKTRRDANGRIVKENFDNRKSQCGFYIADMINERKVLLITDQKKPQDKESIIQELEQVRKKNLDSDLKNALVPKEEVTKRLGRSPDFWDAILMRKAFDYMGGSIRITNRNGNDIDRNALFGDKRRYEKNY